MRPVYHFLPPGNWMNDPNGLIQWQGRYHLFYQYNPAGTGGPGQARMHWGHAVSDDLVHWSDLPLALAPTPGGLDEDGCWSGCAVDHDGVPTLVYSGNRRGRQRTCLARSHDGLLTWEKDPGNPVIAEWPAGLDLVACRDPAVWRQGDDWYQLLGAGMSGAGGAALLYRSHDLVTWEYLHPLLTGEQARDAPVELGTMWECPGLVPLGERSLFFCSPEDERRPYRPAFFIGDVIDLRFMPERGGVLDHGNAFYAPQAMIDEQGRCLMWGWLREARDAEAQRAAGWSGVMSLPRVLSLLPDGALGIEPAPELTALRGAHLALREIDIAPDAGRELEMRGRALEIVATWDPGTARACSIDVACSADGEEATRIRYEPGERRLTVDRRRSSRGEGVQRDVWGDTLDLPDDEPLTLRVFVDHSVVEIFANGRACHATRIYPSLAESDRVRLFAEGGTARLTRLDVWEMASIWEGR